ncbi:hypothetical protein EDB89DRAFT_1901135 [Lactarius sanguifluus]|nr:hypothetical protein EDB89DRAFT_1901135 [Lactarius sanguifluus]
MLASPQAASHHHCPSPAAPGLRTTAATTTTVPSYQCRHLDHITQTPPPYLNAGAPPQTHHLDRATPTVLPPQCHYTTPTAPPAHPLCHPNHATATAIATQPQLYHISHT